MLKENSMEPRVFNENTQEKVTETSVQTVK